MTEGRTAIVLFNLGGPDRLESVGPFLFNLFNDPAIIRLKQPWRGLVARLITWRRTPVARTIYQKIGGSSPLSANTEAQARAIEAALGTGFRTFVAMRYWRKRASETVRDVLDWKPDRVVLLPLYPQFSTTTTGSSLAEWRQVAKGCGLNVPTHLICCYPEEPGLIAGLAERTRAVLARLDDWAGPRRVLFSAHGLPESVVDSGDPYQMQVERTVEAVVAALGDPTLDWRVCYQSRVGPMRWIGPAADAEIRAAGAAGAAVAVVPVSFVSEHSETLVELDIDYRHIAERSGVPRYVRAQTVDTLPSYIGGLARLVRQALDSGRKLCPPDGRRCDAALAGCALQQQESP